MAFIVDPSDLSDFQDRVAGREGQREGDKRLVIYTCLSNQDVSPRKPRTISETVSPCH